MPRGAVGARSAASDGEERDLDAEVAGLRALESAAVDASSLIVMNKSGFLGLAREELRLVTIGAVAREAGSDALGITSFEVQGSGASNDAALVAFAAERGLPLISEDRKVLLAADRLGLPYYDALLVLCSLLARGRIDAEGYGDFRARLVGVSRYSPRVLSYGERLSTHIVKTL